jgi:signal peptidase II
MAYYLLLHSPTMNKTNYFLPVALIVLILALDQWVKYYVKTHFYLGEEVKVIGNWFRLHFTENYGMAYGLEFGGKTGKNLLSIFRILAVTGIGYYIFTLVRKNAHPAYIASWTLICAGAIGNIIDSVYYGVLFGYDTWFQGRVVDMLYFPIIQTTIPEWFPFWKGQDFEFFRPVFNIADTAISVGFILILVFQRKFFKEAEKPAAATYEAHEPGPQETDRRVQ